METIAPQTNKCLNCGAAMAEALDGSFTCTHCGSVFRAGVSGNVLLAGQANPQAGAPAEGPIPRDIALGYHKKRRLPPILWGLIVWAAYGLVRTLLSVLLMENSISARTVFDNPFISPIGGVYWIARTVLFVGVVPVIIYWRRKLKKAP